MNLELIRKYEKEFLHMLHGGTLMFKPNDKHGKAVTFSYGRTSWSSNNDETLFTWQHCELAKD